MAVEWVRYEVLDLSGRSLGWLGTERWPQVVEDCTLDWSQYGQIHGSGSLTLAGSLPWHEVCIAPTRFVRGVTTTQYRRGVYLVSGGRRTVDRRWEVDGDGEPRLVSDERTEVTLYGPELRLSRVPVTDPLDWPAGTRYTDAMADLLAMVGVTDAAITESPLTMPTPWHIAPGVEGDRPRNLLTALNALAEAIGYWSLRFDLDGRATVAPYVPPAARPREFAFSPDPDADWYRGRVGEESDGWSVPNVMVGVARRDGGLPPLVAVVRNHDRGPHSFEARGWWSGPADGPVDVDAPDLATLTAVMERKLALASHAPRTWRVDALWWPVAGSEVGTIVHGDIDAVASLTRWSERVHDVAAPLSLTLEEAL